MARVLVLGGTGFVGRSVSAAALQAGHDVTVLHRGTGPTDILDGTEHVHCDRDDEHTLRAVGRRPFDVVFDVNGYRPAVVAKAGRAFHRSVGRYVFVSSTSVYSDFSRPGVDESGALRAPHPPDGRPVTPTSYGSMKVACELVLRRWFRERLSVVRPGLVVGPNDPTDRLSYWLRRLRGGGDVVAPGDPDRDVQLIDVEDLAGWLVGHWVDWSGHVFNATGPEQRLTVGELLAACVEVTGSTACLRWADDDLLRRHQVEPWLGLPLWIPAGDRDWYGFMAVDSTAARSQGLQHRPLHDSLAAMDQWLAASPGDRPPALQPDREQEILAALAADGPIGSDTDQTARSTVVFSPEVAAGLEQACGTTAPFGTLAGAVAPAALSVPLMQQLVSQDRLGARREGLVLTHVEWSIDRLPQLSEVLEVSATAVVTETPSFALTVQACHQVDAEQISQVRARFAHASPTEVDETVPTRLSALRGAFDARLDKAAVQRWAVVTGDDSAIHVDDEAARRIGLPGACVPGLLAASWAVASAVTAALDGDAGRLGRAEATFRRALLVSEPAICRVWMIPTVRFAIVGPDNQVRVIGALDERPKEAAP